MSLSTIIDQAGLIAPAAPARALARPAAAARAATPERDERRCHACALAPSNDL